MTVNRMIAIVAVSLMATQVSAGEQQVIKSEKDKVNYGVGVSVIRNFQQQGMEIDLDMVYQGMKDALAGKKLQMDEKDLKRTLNAYQTELRRKQQIARATSSVENKKAGEAFIAENGKKEGVVTLPSGLQYKVLRDSKGKKPADSDMVEFHYRGFFVDGSEFDNTYDSEKPAIVKVQEGGGMRGWSEALRLMPVGSKWQVVIPPQLAYGDKGVGRIGPNSTLIFEIELIAIK